MILSQEVIDKAIIPSSTQEENNEWQTIFSAGTHKAADGQEYTYTESDLETIATKYNSQDAHEAPLVIGHPKNDAPAMGWIEGLRRVKDVLQAKYRQVDADFKTAVNAGRFKKVSVALYPDLMLRHVGLFGAGIPAIKGLGNHQFAEGLEYNEYETEFAEIGIEIKDNNTENENFNNQGKKNMTSDEAKTLLTWAEGENFTPEQISALTGQLKKMVDEAAKPADKPADTPPVDSPPKSEFSETAEYKTMRAEKAASDKRILELEKKQQDAEFNEAYGELIQKGKCIPAQKGMYKLLYDNLDTTKQVEFSEGESTTAKDLVFKLIEEMPNLVEFSEFADRNKIDKSDDLAAQTEWIKNHDKNNKQGK